MGVCFACSPSDGVCVDPVAASADDGVLLGKSVRAPAEQDVLGHHDRLHRGTRADQRRD